MAHDQFLREMYEHLDQVDDDVFVPFRPLRPRTRKSGRRVTRTDHMATMRARLTGREIETYAAWQYKRHQQLREIGRKFYEDTRRTLVQIIAEAQGVGGWPIVSVTREELLKKYGEGDEPK